MRFGLNWLLFTLFSSSSSDSKQSIGFRCDRFPVQIFGRSLHWEVFHSEREFPGLFEGLKVAQVEYKWKGSDSRYDWKTNSFPSRNCHKFCFSSCVAAKWNLIHMKEFGCLVCDRNLAGVFSVAVPFYVQTMASVNVLKHWKGLSTLLKLLFLLYPMQI